VRDAGRHLADGRQRCWIRDVALELLDVRHVLEREEQPARPPGVSRCVAVRPISSSPRPSAAESGIHTARPFRGQLALNRSHHGRRQLQHVDNRPADRDAERHGRDRLGAAVERQDPVRAIGRREAARQAVDPRAGSAPAIGDLARRLLSCTPRIGRLSASEPASSADGEKKPNTFSAAV